MSTETSKEAVKCLDCGREFNLLHWSHLRRSHGYQDQAEYRKRHQLDSTDLLHSESYSYNRSLSLKQTADPSRLVVGVGESTNRRNQAHQKLASQGLLTPEAASQRSGINFWTIHTATRRWRLSTESGQPESGLQYTLACPIYYEDGRVFHTSDTKGVKLIPALSLIDFMREFYQARLKEPTRFLS